MLVREWVITFPKRLRSFVHRDPVLFGRVHRIALKNPASVAGLLLTTELIVADSHKDDKHKHPMPDMGGTHDMGM